MVEGEDGVAKKFQGASPVTVPKSEPEEPNAREESLPAVRSIDSLA